MRAVVFTAERDFALEERPVPQIGASEVLLRVAACGICGTDLHAPQLGDLFTPGVVIGHEFAATIVAAGPEVTGFAVGDRVVVNPGGLVCGRCPQCLAGLPNQCAEAMSADIRGIRRDGGMAELAVVDQRHLHHLPEGLTARQGAWAEPLAVAVRGVGRARVGVGTRVAVLGAGAIGQLVAQVARVSGAAEVLVVETSALRRDVALACGASAAIAPDAVADVDALYDVVFDCSGAPPALQSAIDLVTYDGTVVVVGAYSGPVTIADPAVAQGKEVRLAWSLSYRDRQEFAAALELLARGAVDVDRLTSAVMPLHRHAEAFTSMKDPEQAIKVLIAPEDA